MHSLEIVQWDSTRRDHPGYPGRVSGSSPVIMHMDLDDELLGIDKMSSSLKKEEKERKDRKTYLRFTFIIELDSARCYKGEDC